MMDKKNEDLRDALNPPAADFAPAEQKVEPELPGMWDQSDLSGGETDYPGIAIAALSATQQDDRA